MKDRGIYAHNGAEGVWGGVCVYQVEISGGERAGLELRLEWVFAMGGG